MDFRSSPFVRSLRARENEFLQVLLTEFSLKRLGEGSLLSIYFGGDMPTISVREAKHDIKSRIPDFESQAKELQQQLDDFLVEKTALVASTAGRPDRVALIADDRVRRQAHLDGVPLRLLDPARLVDGYSPVTGGRRHKPWPTRPLRTS